MPQLVTGLFYERAEAERAVQMLRSRGFGTDDIYLEQEVEPTGEIGAKGGEVTSAEQERRFAGLETGLIIGLIVGTLAGMGVGMLGQGIAEAISQDASTQMNLVLPAVITHPLLASLAGAVIGLITGGIVGWMVDFTLTRMGAGPALPKEETLVTVRVADGALDYAYASLFDARARHLHIANRSA